MNKVSFVRKQCALIETKPTLLTVLDSKNPEKMSRDALRPASGSVY
ncbi:MAG: hypothetical protein GXO48_02360 [Chlorobi bacterium]|nr:hypothetical protein [Chlorobiota bacterium]